MRLRALAALVVIGMCVGIGVFEVLGRSAASGLLCVCSLGVVVAYIKK